MKTTRRSRQVAGVIREQLVTLFQRKIMDEQLRLLTITAVDMSLDLSRAKIFFNIMQANPDEIKIKNILSILAESKKEIRYLLAKEIKLRYVPELQFVYDDSLERTTQLAQLIQA